MRRNINDRKTPHGSVGLAFYCKISVTLDMQSVHYEVPLHNYQNRTILTFFEQHNLMRTITRR